MLGASGAYAADCEITVGLVMELTGPAGEYGQAGAKSVEMAFRDINDAGGAQGCMLVTDTRDSQSQGITDVMESVIRSRPLPAPSKRAARECCSAARFTAGGSRARSSGTHTIANQPSHSREIHRRAHHTCT